MPPAAAARIRLDSDYIDIQQTLDLRGRSSPLPPPPDEAPLGYELLEILGRGGMGTVVKARHLELDRIVALKLIRTDVAQDPEYQQRFHGEAESAAQLRHPGIVQIYSVGQWRGAPYLAMECVEGWSLDQRLDRGPLTPAEAAELVEALADAMEHAHLCGVIHRDLKPGNILIAGPETRAADGPRETDVRGRDSNNVERSQVVNGTARFPKIVDFGLAKRFADSNSQTKTGQLLGTPSYMSPEQTRCRGEVGPATDIYSLGAILYECLTGRPPFHGATSLQTMEQVVRDDPVPPRRLQPTVPRDLETICLKCLSKEPRQRYVSAGALADDLRAWREGRPIRARPVSFVERSWKYLRRRPAVAALVGVTSMAAFALLAGGAYHNVRLRESLSAESAARADASEQARQARERFDIALAAHKQLVAEVRELAKNPATRTIQRRMLESAIKGLASVANSYDSAEPDLRRAEAHSNLANLYRELGKSQDAGRHVEECLRVLAALLEVEPYHNSAHHLRCQAMMAHLRLFVDAQRIREAEQIARRFIVAVEEWQSRCPNEDVTYYTLQGLTELAHMLIWNRRLEEAAPVLERALPLAREWAAANPNSQERMKILDLTLDRHRAYYDALGDLAKARECSAEALSVAQRIADARPDERHALHALLVHTGNVGELDRDLGDMASARKHIVAAVDLARRLHHIDPENVDYQCNMAMALAKVGELDGVEYDPEPALKHFDAAWDFLERMRKAGTLESRRFYQIELRGIVENGRARMYYGVHGLDEPLLPMQLPFNDYVEAHALRLVSYFRKGRWEDAKATCELLKDVRATLTPQFLHQSACWAGCYGVVTDPELRAACREQTLLRLRDALASGEVNRVKYVTHAPVFATIRSDPEFQAILSAK